jgi:hypothetical protein
MFLQSKKLPKYLYIISIILLLTLSCRVPTAEELPGGDFDPHNLDFVDFTTDVFVHYDSQCINDYVPPKTGVQSFEVVGENLFVTRGEEKIEYKGEPGAGLYCKDIAKGGEECIDLVSENEYLLAVRDPHDPVDYKALDFCYEESHTIKPVIKTIESCIVPVSSYEMSYSEPSNKFSTETKKVCQGTFYLENKSPTDILISYFNKYHNGKYESEKWLDGFHNVESGDTFSKIYEAQNWTDGSYTLDTITELVVISDNISCMIIFNPEYLYLWEDYSMELNDPCD